MGEGPICEIEEEEENQTLQPNDDDDDDICSFPPDAGPCEALFPSWFFNVKSGKCEEFDYGGCDGNANRFKSKNDCEEFCPSSSMGENTIDNVIENQSINLSENGMDNMGSNKDNEEDNGISDAPVSTSTSSSKSIMNKMTMTFVA